MNPLEIRCVLAPVVLAIVASGCGKAPEKSDSKTPSLKSKTGEIKSPAAKTSGAPKSPKLEPVAFNIPDRPLSGTIHGQRFQPDKFELDGTRLSLTAGKGLFGDYQFQVSLPADSFGEQVDGKAYEINPPLEFATPFVNLRWKTPGKSFGDTATINKYALKVVFGKRMARRIAGRIHFRSLALGDDKTEFAGTFTAEIAPDLNKPPTELDVPYIHGTVTIKNDKNFKIAVGMTGVTAKGERVGNSVGGISAQRGGAGASLTFKPQITAFRTLENGTVSFRHISLNPGIYLAYVTRDQQLAAWKWIEVDAKAQIRQDFTIDASQFGNLEVQTDGAAGQMVSITPLRMDGTLPGGAEKVSVSFRLKLSKPADRKTVFQNLPAGRFRVRYRGKTADVTVAPGKTTTVKVD